MKVSQKIQYVLVMLVFKILSLLPLKLLFLFSEVLMFFVYHVFRYRKNVVFSNIRNSFPDKSNKEVNHITRKYFRHMSVMIVENVYLHSVSWKKAKNKLILKNPEVFNNEFDKGRSVILMFGHFGNWEYGTLLAGLLPFKFMAVYQKLSSLVFDKIYFSIRSRFGVQPVEMKEVLRKVVDARNNKEQIALCMVADQGPTANATQYWLPFLNQDTPVHLGSEKMAKKFNMSVIYCEFIREKKGTYNLYSKLITDNSNAEPDFAITNKFFDNLEQSIKRSSRYWLWSHRRWKNKRNKSDVKKG